LDFHSAGYALQTLKQAFSQDLILPQLVLPYEILTDEGGGSSGGADDNMVWFSNPMTVATWQEFMKKN
jgi:membrane-associated protease RseP (regulator of RpoE activity)